MTGPSLETIIEGRLALHGLVVEAAVVGRCAAYLGLLSRWNRRINLTALPLDGPQLELTIDKLIVEPLKAAAVTPFSGQSWFDLGSGGGSPAIPMRIVNPAGSMVMVESRERKCAFLREAVRVTGLARTSVENCRFDAIQRDGIGDLVTVRAVRIDFELVDLVAGLLRSGGVLVAFGTAPSDSRFEFVSQHQLPDGSFVSISRRVDVPRGTLS